MNRSQIPNSITKGSKTMMNAPPKGSKMPGMGSKKGMGKGKPAVAKATMPEMPAFKKGGMVGCNPKKSRRG